MKNFKLLFIIYGIAYFYSIFLLLDMDFFNKCKTPICNKISNLHESCIMGCKNILCDIAKNSRGNGYNAEITDDIKRNNLKTCFITFWNFTHFCLYFIIGFLLPDMFWESITIGVLFECYEKYKYDCADVIDVLCNTSGFLLGFYLNGFK